MTTTQRLLRIYKDSCILGLYTQEPRRLLIRWTGEKPGKDWLKRVEAYAKAEKK